MRTAENQALPAPPSLIGALRAGFDAITNHITLIIFPIALDIFLWLGPHLRFNTMIRDLADQFSVLPGVQSPETTEALRLSREFWLFIGERLNLFSLLRSYPVGVPSLMAGSQPVETPFGLPPFWEVLSLPSAIGGWLVFSLIGLVLGSLYFLVVAQAAIAGEVDWRYAARRWPWASGQVILLALFWLAIIMAISLPGSCLVTLISMVGPAVARFGILFIGGIGVWILFPLVFSAHGIFLKGGKMWRSVLDGVRLTRMTFPKTSLLFLSIVVISQGLDILWRVPEEGSWLTIIGVAGHALVTTSLLAASFVYYRDAERWIQRLVQKSQLSSVGM